MRILLINTVPDYVKEKATLPLGLLSIATYLTKFGHTVKIYDRAVDRGSVKKHIKDLHSIAVWENERSCAVYSE